MVRARWTLLPMALALAACEGPPQRLAGSRPDATTPSTSLVQERTGLTRLPRPADLASLDAALKRHYPREYVGKRQRTAVLVDVRVDERGRVRNVKVVDRPPQAPANMRAVLVDREPGTGRVMEREFTAEYDPAFGPAARNALLDVRFLPAMRGEVAVPYTVRMTVEFTSPEPGA